MSIGTMRTTCGALLRFGDAFCHVTKTHWNAEARKSLWCLWLPLKTEAKGCCQVWKKENFAEIYSGAGRLVTGDTGGIPRDTNQQPCLFLSSGSRLVLPLLFSSSHIFRTANQPTTKSSTWFSVKCVPEQRSPCQVVLHRLLRRDAACLADPRRAPYMPRPQDLSA